MALRESLGVGRLGERARGVDDAERLHALHVSRDPRRALSLVRASLDRVVGVHLAGEDLFAEARHRDRRVCDHTKGAAPSVLIVTARGLGVFSRAHSGRSPSAAAKAVSESEVGPAVREESPHTPPRVPALEMSVKSTHGAFEVDGIHTEVLVSDYGNRVMVLATQIGKLGTMYLTVDPGPGGAVGPEPPEVRTLTGRHDDEMLEAAARRLAQVVQSRGCDKPVLVSLGLRPKLEMGTLRGVVRAASDFATESLELAPRA